MNSRIPTLINPLLSAYQIALQTQLPTLIQGLYIGGSIALGEFNPRLSDIDFLTILRRPATTAELQQLKTIHKTLATQYPQAPLSGSYILPDGLGKQAHEVAPHPYFHDHTFHESGHFEINFVTWWVLKYYGITLMGPEPQTLSFDVDWRELRAAMHTNLNTYWRGWTSGRQAVIGLASDEGIQWAVTGVSRLFYSFHESDITTKVRAAEYALQRVPPRWHRIIREALRLREGSPSSLYRWRLVRMLDARAFLKAIIQASNEFIARLNDVSRETSC